MEDGIKADPREVNDSELIANLQARQILAFQGFDINRPEYQTNSIIVKAKQCQIVA